MEKVMYHVWKEQAVERDSFRDRLVGELVEKLPELGVKASRAAVYDDYIDKGQSVRVKLTGGLERRIEAFGNNCLCRIIGYRWFDRVTNRR